MRMPHLLCSLPLALLLHRPSDNQHRQHLAPAAHRPLDWAQPVHRHLAQLHPQHRRLEAAHLAVRQLLVQPAHLRLAPPAQPLRLAPLPPLRHPLEAAVCLGRQPRLQHQHLAHSPLREGCLGRLQGRECLGRLGRRRVQQARAYSPTRRQSPRMAARRTKMGILSPSQPCRHTLTSLWRNSGTYFPCSSDLFLFLMLLLTAAASPSTTAWFLGLSAGYKSMLCRPIVHCPVSRCRCTAPCFERLSPESSHTSIAHSVCSGGVQV